MFLRASVSFFKCVSYSHNIHPVQEIYISGRRSKGVKRTIKSKFSNQASVINRSKIMIKKTCVTV